MQAYLRLPASLATIEKRPRAIGGWRGGPAMVAG